MDLFTAMAKNGERVSQRQLASEHLVQLFDTPESLGSAVARFLNDGVLNGDSLLVVAKPGNLDVIAAGLESLGTSIRPLLDRRQLTMLDAHATLRSFMWNGRPDRGTFYETVGAAVQDLTADRTRGVRIYGEMVELLAEEANFTGAAELEELWNELGATAPFQLLCGYSSAHFAAPNAGRWLGDICQRHTCVRQDAEDLLATWLLNTTAANRNPLTTS